MSVLRDEGISLENRRSRTGSRWIIKKAPQSIVTIYTPTPDSDFKGKSIVTPIVTPEESIVTPGAFGVDGDDRCRYEVKDKALSGVDGDDRNDKSFQTVKNNTLLSGLRDILSDGKSHKYSVLKARFCHSRTSDSEIDTFALDEVLEHLKKNGEAFEPTPGTWRLP